MHRFVLAALLALAPFSMASAQTWAEKMFAETSHNFGSVARGALAEHQFVIKNIYGEEIHVRGVRSSCGCTTPRVIRNTLAPGEQTAVVAHFNTDTFSGQRGAKLTVTFDKPYYAEVQVEVYGYIRTDVVVSPGQVAFGSVDQGSMAAKKVTVNYIGRSNWKILEARSASPYLTANVREMSRGGSQVSYELSVELADNAPSGYLNDQVTLVTNDQRTEKVPVTVSAIIASEVTVSPSNVLLGNLQPGQTVTKQNVVRAKKPFTIRALVGSDPSFSYEANDEAKQVHLIPVTITAPTKPGKILQKIVVETNDGPNAKAELTIHGQVVTPLAAGKLNRQR